MVTYRERYQALAQRKDLTFDEYQQASASLWAELMGLGSFAFEEELAADVQALARAVMERARQNVATLYDHLNTLGYPFYDPASAWQPPDDVFLGELDAFESRCGPLPVLLRAWFEIVGRVEFMGFQTPEYRMALRLYTELVQANEREQSFVQEEEQSELILDYLVHGDPLYISCDPTGELPLAPGSAEPDFAAFVLELSPDPIFKAGESGAGTISCIVSRGRVFDCPLFIAGRWSGDFFFPYLQCSFRWGGFGGLSEGNGVALAMPVIRGLTKDLLPI